VSTASSASAPVTYRGLNGRIAFARYSSLGNPPQLFAMSATGSAQKQLLHHDGEDAEPSWAPDGRRLVFTSVTAGNVQGIFVTTRSGVLERLTAHVYDPQSPLLDAHARWSPDGKRIVFHRYKRTGSELYVVNADGSGLRKIGDGFEPAWSPDGRRIVFAYLTPGTTNYDIYAMNADGSGRRQLTNTSEPDNDPDWSPDGQRIAFVSHRDGNYEIYTMRADGTQQRRLTYIAAEDYSPVWSPDGKRIVFTSRRLEAQWDIYVMRADGSNQTRLTTSRDDESQPSWQSLPRQR
jgi:TolB protein